ncbi:DUF2635 domain-containing protein [uncultured Pseudacidovorax sp.]|uniref:DUF2635 domain-containing protein n=1 Tax=uncultured Pseudacidovorax sp. TaxID=679313 RepID=UPI0025F342E2|nr:DUF2635 domain-containing protein [uncultured Pseudacidovorax sp.]
MLVKAAEGLVVIDPDLKDRLPPEGRDVPDNDYWQRRLRDGDVVLVIDGISVPETKKR